MGTKGSIMQIYDEIQTNTDTYQRIYGILSDFIELESDVVDCSVLIMGLMYSTDLE